ETLVGCGLAVKLTYGDGSARYDSRTDPHHHARCLSCGAVMDVPGRLAPDALAGLGPVDGFDVQGYRLELVGRCAECAACAAVFPSLTLTRRRRPRRRSGGGDAAARRRSPLTPRG